MNAVATFERSTEPSSGVRPSSGAATFIEHLAPPLPSRLAAPEDGRTPLFVLVTLVCLLFSAGCSKKSEPKITGKRSDPPVSLQCVWKPGYRYHLRMDLAVLTDADAVDPQETGL